jgi:hypothetical protein
MKMPTYSLVVFGCGLVAAAGVALYSVKRSGDSSSVDDVPPIRDHVSDTRKPPVVYWFDSALYRVADAVRIDVRHGVAHSRSEDAPIADVVAYVNAELDRRRVSSVVVTSGPEEKIGDVVRVIDECRKSRAKTVIMNEYLGEFWKK